MRNERPHTPSSSSHSRSSEVPSSLVERVLVVKSQLLSVLGVTTVVSDDSPGERERECTTHYYKHIMLYDSTFVERQHKDNTN